MPFQASTDDGGAVLDVILNRLGLPAMDEATADAASTHRNDVVAFKSEFAHRIVKLVKNNPAYPKFRSLVGGERIRKVRSALTKEAPRESLDEALATCTDEQRAGARRPDTASERSRDAPPTCAGCPDRIVVGRPLGRGRRGDQREEAGLRTPAWSAELERCCDAPLARPRGQAHGPAYAGRPGQGRHRLLVDAAERGTAQVLRAGRLARRVAGRGAVGCGRPGRPGAGPRVPAAACRGRQGAPDGPPRGQGPRDRTASRGRARAAGPGRRPAGAGTGRPSPGPPGARRGRCDAGLRQAGQHRHLRCATGRRGRAPAPSRRSCPRRGVRSVAAPRGQLGRTAPAGDVRRRGPADAGDRRAARRGDASAGRSRRHRRVDAGGLRLPGPFAVRYRAGPREGGPRHPRRPPRRDRVALRRRDTSVRRLARGLGALEHGSPRRRGPALGLGALRGGRPGRVRRLALPRSAAAQRRSQAPRPRGGDLVGRAPLGARAGSTSRPRQPT